MKRTHFGQMTSFNQGPIGVNGINGEIGPPGPKVSFSSVINPEQVDLVFLFLFLVSQMSNNTILNIFHRDFLGRQELLAFKDP